MTEQWKPVNGYEGIYEVSSMGRVRSVSRTTKSSNKFGDYTYTIEGRILKAFTQRGGYQRISFGKGANKKAFMVHRLVAEAFIPNPDNKPFINHIDENPRNNHVSNLEWCTTAENNIYGNHIANAMRHRAVEQLTMDGVLIQRYESIVEASRTTGCRTTSILSCCRGRFKSSLGYRWRYAQ